MTTNEQLPLNNEPRDSVALTLLGIAMVLALTFWWPL